MAHPFDTIGIFAKRRDDHVRRTLDALIEDLLARGKNVVLEDNLAVEREDLERCSRLALGGTCDLVIVVGGDGTLLDAGRAVAAHDTPLLGVNLGRLGFMVDVLPADMKTTLDDVFEGRYIADSRLMLEARIQHDDGQFETEVFPAINECVIRNQAFVRVLDFDSYMNGDFISSHRADGIVIATPTGSTGYALSGGGPVLHPGLNAMALVPVCPHTLSERPVIVDAAHQIEVHVAATHDGKAIFTCDGQVTHPLSPGDRVLVQRNEQELQLIHPPGYDYFSILRNKLQWGRSQTTPQR